MQTQIYALKDEVGNVRYIGKTSHSVSKRFSRHLADGRNGVSTHKACWIRGMQQRGLEPTVDVVETVDGDGLDQERVWIATLRSGGVNLTNLTDGGDGLCGYVQSDEARAATSASLKEYYKTHDMHNKGKKLSAETRGRMSAAKTGTTATPQARKNISEARKGMKFSPEHIANLKKSHSGPSYKGNGRVMTEATRAKISASMKKAHAEGRGAKQTRDDNGHFIAKD